MNRRFFVRSLIGGAIAIPAATACYGAFEAGRVSVSRREIAVPRLPKSFVGFRIVFLTDIHHGPYTDDNHLRQIVRTTNLLDPDLIALGGDYCLRDKKYIAPCFAELRELRSRHGLFGVLGNHDYWHGLNETQRGMKYARIEELTNAGLWLTKGNDRLRLVGVDDHWEGKPTLLPSLRGVREDESAIVLSHNPDYAEGIDDRRVGLVLSGHTHGGQVVFPGNRSPFVPSAYGAKYLHGLCQAPGTQVYVSRGLGTAVVPLRLGSRPELTLITLTAAV